MKVKFFVRKSAKKVKPKSVPVYVRVRDDVMDLWQKTTIVVAPDAWDNKEERLKSRIVMDEQERFRFNSEIEEMRKFITERYLADSEKARMTQDWLPSVLVSYAKLKSAPAPKEKKKDIGDLFDKFLAFRDCDEPRKEQYRVVKRALQRYELFVRATKQKNFQLDVRKVDADMLHDMWRFMENEHIWYEKYPEIYEKIPNTKKVPMKRGRNTLSGCFKKISAFFNWCMDSQHLIEKTPFEDFKIPEEVYGEPIYITKEEMHKIYTTDLSQWPDLDRQRDVFIFQCCVGCRVGDLLGKSKDDIVNGAFQYMPSKTISEDARTVVVPLNKIAKAILKKYPNLPDNMLLPFLPPQDYNSYIRLVFTKVGITRKVSWRNPLTGKEEKRPINEIASSHMARRTFVGNLYKELKDPNLIGVLSGHVEGSRAFSRYRAIDREMKESVVKILDK